MYLKNVQISKIFVQAEMIIWQEQDRPEWNTYNYLILSVNKTNKNYCSPAGGTEANEF